MRVTSLLAFVASACAVSAATTKPDVDVSIKFPDSNPFGRVTNGPPNNLLQVKLANHAGEEIVITKVHAQYREAGGRERPLRNTTTLTLQQPVLPGLSSPLIPYKFHSENKIGEVGLRVWVDYLDAGKKLHTVLGYEGTVTIVEPSTNWFDFEVLFLYAIIASLFGGLGYWAYNSYIVPTYFPKQKAKSKKPRSSAAPPSAPSTPAKVATSGADSPAASTTAYEEEWIPEHVLRSRKAAEKKEKKLAGGYTSATSGEESEGGAKARKGKGKK